MDEPNRTTPIILVAGGQWAEAIRQELSSRYSRDYEITVVTSAAQARARAMELREAGARLAMVAVEYELPDARATDVLRKFNHYAPTAKRVCMVPPPRFREALGELRAAVASGDMDAYLVVPSGVRDEEFHAAVTDLLSDWGWSAGGVEVDGIQVVGSRSDARVGALCDFFDRMGMPHRVYAPDTEVGRELAAVTGPEASGPLVRTVSGAVFDDPAVGTISDEIFGVLDQATLGVVDLAIVGAGPAGLAASVYAASEGLTTIALDASAIGGQAGTSSMIRNYLGFPRGISGMRLAQRARIQATRFGAKFLAGHRVSELRLASGPGEPHRLRYGDRELAARAVLIATGVEYRRLGVEPLEELVGAASTTGRPRARPGPWPGSRSTWSGAATRRGRRPSTWPASRRTSRWWSAAIRWPRPCPTT